MLSQNPGSIQAPSRSLPPMFCFQNTLKYSLVPKFNQYFKPKLQGYGLQAFYFWHGKVYWIFNHSYYLLCYQYGCYYEITAAIFDSYCLWNMICAGYLEFQTLYAFSLGLFTCSLISRFRLVCKYFGRLYYYSLFINYIYI